MRNFLADFSMPHIGRFKSGTLDAITDVKGVAVGHSTLNQGAVQTGVTVIKPHSGNLFMQKVPAAVSVINGFGKSVGLVQVKELGTLETPIALTNTFSVPALSIAQIKEAIVQNPECGRKLSTVNSLVMECNDGYLNDIQRMVITPEHYSQARASAAKVFGVGSVGAGRGMSCFGLKGGVGTSSRIIYIEQEKGLKEYTLGTLVLANFGMLERLTIDGQKVGERILKQYPSLSDQSLPEGRAVKDEMSDKGSIIMLLATDAPIDSRQLKRIANRAAAGLARTGSYYGHGSGDIALAFSTAYTVAQEVKEIQASPQLLLDQQLEGLFEAVADSVEQAILSALWHSQTTQGRDGHERVGLLNLLKGELL